MKNQEVKDTGSDSFGREIETAEASFFDEDFEEYFYEEQMEIIDLFKINELEALERRAILLKEVGHELKSEKDENFKRFSLFTEILTKHDYRESLKEIKKTLVEKGVKNFLLEFHTGKDGNSNHIQYTGNKSDFAKEEIVKYINKNSLSMHYKNEQVVQEVKTQKPIIKSIIEQLNQNYEKLDNFKIDKTKSVQDIIKEAKEYEQNFKKEKNHAINTYEYAKQNRRFRR